MNYMEFQVGEKFPLPIQAQGDGGIFQYDINGAMFILKLSKVDLIAIEAFRTGKIELALFTEQNILFLLYKIDGIFNGWGDCPYSIHYHETAQQPDFTKPQDKAINLYLVDSRLDILLAMRTAALTEEFHGALVRLIEAQKETPISKEHYVAAVQKIWQRHTPDEMVLHAVSKQELSLERITSPGIQ